MNDNQQAVLYAAKAGAEPGENWNTVIGPAPGGV